MANTIGGMTRRSAIGGALGTAALAVAVPGLAHTPGAKPNFLFIMADDLGYADLSCYGRREYRTPALDSLAAQGMKFTHGYANSAVCSATRVGLITGRYQYRLAVGLEEPLETSAPPGGGDTSTSRSTAMNTCSTSSPTRWSGNLKDRQPDVFAALKQAFDDWNAGMLSDPAASSFSSGPQHLADHYDQPD